MVIGKQTITMKIYHGMLLTAALVASLVGGTIAVANRSSVQPKPEMKASKVEPVHQPTLIPYDCDTDLPLLVEKYRENIQMEPRWKVKFTHIKHFTTPVDAEYLDCMKSGLERSIAGFIFEPYITQGPLRSYTFKRK